MLAELYRRARHREGIAEGRQLERAEWVAWREKLDSWESRRDEAGKNGQSFTEPRPAPPA